MRCHVIVSKGKQTGFGTTLVPCRRLIAGDMPGGTDMRHGQNYTDALPDFDIHSLCSLLFHDRDPCSYLHVLDTRVVAGKDRRSLVRELVVVGEVEEVVGEM